MNEDEYLEVGLISRLANGNVARTIGIVTAVAMVVPIGFWVIGLLAR